MRSFSFQFINHFRERKLKVWHLFASFASVVIPSEEALYPILNYLYMIARKMIVGDGELLD